MFSHGINIIGMWLVVDILERKTGVKHISQLGGVAQKAPVLTIFLVIIALANIALPLTNAFVGEFLMLSGLFKLNIWFAVMAGLGVILAAVYTLRMIQKVFYGNTNSLTENISDISFSERAALSVIVVFIFVIGVMPQHVIHFTQQAVTDLVAVLER
jgi:NADH-quinone oxidoreductase subunit M